MAIYSGMLRLFRSYEGSGNTLNDTSANALDGTADGTLIWVDDPDLGIVPDLGGTVQINCGDVAGANGAVLTIAGWAKFAGAPSVLEVVAGKWDSTGNQKSWRLWRSATGQLQFVPSLDGAANGATKTVASFWPDGVAHHFVLEFNASVVSVWKDLVAQTVTGSTTAVSIFDSTAPLYLGGYGTGGGTDPADSRFKDIVIWNRVITAEERQKAFDGEFWDYSIEADLAIGMSLASGMWPIYSAIGDIGIGIGSLSTTQFMAPGGSGSGPGRSFGFDFSFSF